MSGLAVLLTCPPGSMQAEMALAGGACWKLTSRVLKDQGRRGLSGKASLEPELGQPSRDPGERLPAEGNGGRQGVPGRVWGWPAEAW